MKFDANKTTVCIVGLGYVGLPLAEVLAQHVKVIGFDVDSTKVNELSQSNNQNLLVTDKPEEIGKADIIIICVPTPVTKSKEPDLSYVEKAAEVVGQNMKKGSIVILESTVYPGATEEIVAPILERESALKCGQDFKIAYCPERINPGDEEHTIDKVIKVVSGMDNETAELVAELYRKIALNVFKAKDIKTAEAVKVVENIQRDLNIALMNELSLIFDKMGISIKDVIEAAATKWNFQRYSPGLVGGHCIPVDPYYLVYKAEKLGYHPQVIMAGRAINDYMPKHVVEMTIKALKETGKVIKGSKVLIMGLTYKENVPDTRETAAKEIINELKEQGVQVFGYDPLLNNIEEEFGIPSLSSLENILDIDGTVLLVAHKDFSGITLNRLKGIMNANPVLIDLRGAFAPQEAAREGIHYLSL